MAVNPVFIEQIRSGIIANYDRFMKAVPYPENVKLSWFLFTGNINAFSEHHDAAYFDELFCSVYGDERAAQVIANWRNATVNVESHKIIVKNLEMRQFNDASHLEDQDPEYIKYLPFYLMGGFNIQCIDMYIRGIRTIKDFTSRKAIVLSKRFPKIGHEEILNLGIRLKNAGLIMDYFFDVHSTFDINVSNINVDNSHVIPVVTIIGKSMSLEEYAKIRDRINNATGKTALLDVLRTDVLCDKIGVRKKKK